MNQIITSLLETDMYKFSMGQAIYHQFSDYKTTWSFKCRNKDVHFTSEMVDEIKKQILVAWKERGGSKNPQIGEVVKRLGNPNALKDVNSAKEYLTAVENIPVAE